MKLRSLRLRQPNLNFDIRVCLETIVKKNKNARNNCRKYIFQSTSILLYNVINHVHSFHTNQLKCYANNEICVITKFHKCFSLFQMKQIIKK